MKKLSFITVATLIFLCAKAQTESGDTAMTNSAGKATVPAATYMMPDGSFIAKDKIDSVRKAWNGALMFSHEDKDKDQDVIHLLRLSDAEMRQIAEQNARADSAVKVMLGKAAPDFTLTDITGHQWSLAALRGKVVVLNFWFTSCPPCNAEMPQLNEITKMYGPDKVVFLALTFNEAQKVKTYLQTHEFSYHVITGTKAIDQQYKISGWPTSLVINKNGVITCAFNISEDIIHDLCAAIDADL